MPNTTLYFRSDTSPNVAITHQPSGLLGGWDAGNPAITKKALSTTSGSAQQTITFPGGLSAPGSTNTHWAIIQYLSDPLAAQSQSSTSSGTSAGGASSESAATANFTYLAYFFMGLVDGTNGTLKTSIYPVNFFNSGVIQTTSGERTGYNTGLTWQAWTSALNDYLVVEYGILFRNLSASAWNIAANEAKVYDCGTTAISSNNASTSDAQAFVTFPYTVTFNVAAGGLFRQANLATGSGGPFFSNPLGCVRPRLHERGRAYGGRIFDGARLLGGAVRLGGPVLLGA
jgi:hypothetical protein